MPSDTTRQLAREIHAPGAACTVLPENVGLLDPQLSVFLGMLEGWRRNQLSRTLKDQSITMRLQLVERFHGFTNEYPWRWTSADVDSYWSQLRGRTDDPVKASTVRHYQYGLHGFMEFITHPAYGWPDLCEERFGERPIQIISEWNMARHAIDEANPQNRPLTHDELQTFFDFLDDRVDVCRRRKRKGALAALRDSAFFKFVYAWGLRRREALMVDVVDLRYCSSTPQYGSVGQIAVRWGKALRGGAPRSRSVLSLPEFEWAMEALQQYVEEVRPLFAPGKHPALWLTERHGRISPQYADERFAEARDSCGISGTLRLHCLRHSYTTHCIEYGYPEAFIQTQLGHRNSASTAVYTSVGNDYMNRVLSRAVTGGLLGEPR